MGEYPLILPSSENHMINNDVLRRMRYLFDLDDTKMINIYGLAGVTASRAEISDWLKRDDDPDYVECSDTSLAAFLNGFIVLKRGKKDDSEVVNEAKLTNNIIFNKIKIALTLKSPDILDLLSAAGIELGKHELSAFFRKAEHKNYRHCNDQIMRKLFQGLQKIHRPSTKPFSWD